MNSILNWIKDALDINPDITAFDRNIIMHINSALMAVNQLGIGPATGFTISNADAVWTDLIGVRTDLSSIQTYIYLKVRMVFDPPSSSYVLQSMANQITELEWRLNMQAEGGD